MTIKELLTLAADFDGVIGMPTQGHLNVHCPRCMAIVIDGWNLDVELAKTVLTEHKCGEGTP